MLRYILLATAISISSLALTSQAHAQYQVYSQDEEHITPTSDTRPVPWPWSRAQPFPWFDIQGLWKVEQDDFISYFTFRVVKERATGERQLRVKQIDGLNCREIANGVGVAVGSERSQRILARMKSKAGTDYRVQITAFAEQDSPERPLQGNIPVQSVMVVSISSADGPRPISTPVHMQIMKVSGYQDLSPCREDLKK